MYGIKPKGNVFLDEAKKIPKLFEIETLNILGIDEIHIQREGKSRKQAWTLICNRTPYCYRYA
ncbi:hypothetical protein [Clostridium sp. CMCC3677]|uniref:Transposase n=1 Tax=Clostridium aquiflavi TaxID=3073603 RepID=A0ABU1EI66_9CLOT|nr:hypothetical protein [Clostridium sp. CMCC3677]MDR5588094.1 hypothetical protein [Clostridium sp. 5N-1]NFQ10146.1 hypothetical protein [Clostridium botulinum]